MVRARGTNILNSVNRGHQHEDGYVLVGPDGYSVESTLMQDTLFSSMSRSATGLWSATLKEAYPCNLQWFKVEPVHIVSGNPLVIFKLLNDNVGVAGTTNSSGSNPQIIHWEFVNIAGSAVDLPANGGFKYMIGLQFSTAYYTKIY